MMKKFTLAIIVAAAMMISCGGKKADNASGEVVVQTEEVVGQAFIDENNAQLALDYPGTYQGVLPTADGEGMDVTIVLGDSTYTKTVSYVGKTAAPIVEEGIYVWGTDGNTISLQGVTAPNQYFVSENVLIQLDTEGKRIEGNLADQYKLGKKN